MDTALDVENISKVFHLNHSRDSRIFGLHCLYHKLFRKDPPSFSALDQISFSLNKGQSLGIIGFNGAGKSTLLQILSGVMKPSSGKFLLKGKVAALLELGSGFNPNFTGKENVYLNASLFGLSKKEIDSRFQSILNFSDIGMFMYQPVKTYSSGMIFRLSFAVVTHVDADILIIDEALAVGDALFVQKCMRFIKDFQKNGTLILVTHDHSNVHSLCEKCLWLDNGKVKRFGNSKLVVDEYISSLLSIKRPNNNLINKKIIGLDKLGRINTEKLGLRQKGEGGAIINCVSLINNKNSEEIINFTGNEEVRLSINVALKRSFSMVVVGFIFRNKHGLELFSDNFKIENHEISHQQKPNQFLKVDFDFQMPVLRKGDYSISVAVAEEIDGIHNFQSWIDDILVVRSISPDLLKGLVGIPIKKSSELK